MDHNFLFYKSFFGSFSSKYALLRSHNVIQGFNCTTDHDNFSNSERVHEVSVSESLTKQFQLLSIVMEVIKETKLI